MILALKTDNPVAEISFYSPKGEKIHHYSWQADRQLAQTLMQVLTELMDVVQADFSALTGVVVYKGPGSFTGLRIGITVANTIAYAQNIPIVGALGDNWVNDGLNRLVKLESDRIVLPHYGAEANISKPKG